MKLIIQTTLVLFLLSFSSSKPQPNPIPKMKIEIWSDVACPFCYLGKRNLEKAIATLPFKDELSVEWKSFELSPGLTTDTTLDIETFLSNRKGYPIQQVKQMNQQVVQAGKNIGLEINTQTIVVANTNLAHQLIHFAKTNNTQNEAKELLLKAYFTLGKNVDDMANLLAIAQELNLDTVKVKEALSTKQHALAVQSDIQEAQNLGVTGVPFFVINRKYAINGAQASEVFVQNIQKAYTEWKQNQAQDALQITPGKSCKVDEGCD